MPPLIPPIRDTSKLSPKSSLLWKLNKQMKKAKNSLDKKIEYLLYLLVFNFIFLLSQIFIPLVENIFMGNKLFLLPFATFSFWGFLLVYWLRKSKIQGELKKSLTLTGYSAGFIFITSVLHNILSGLGMILLNKEFEEPLFFILATIVLPVLFIIGVLKSILKLRKL